MKSSINDLRVTHCGAFQCPICFKSPPGVLCPPVPWLPLTLRGALSIPPTLIYVHTFHLYLKLTYLINSWNDTIGIFNKLI
jgi:hypothetical protein